tara:strand:+ start:498 stop:4184 length:3687 start_codon:yes stop_codon:yes gene_type:complete
MSSLAEQNETLIKGGFSQKEISNWKQEKIFSLEQGGYEQEEILKEFGYQPIERGPIKKIWNNIITLGKEEKKSTYEKLLEVEKNEPDNISLKEKLVGETFEFEKYWNRGFNMGIIDLVQNYHQLPGNSGTGLPEGYVAEPFEDTGIIERNVQNLAVITKDLPVYLTGALLTNLLTFGRAGKVVTAAGTGFFAGSIRETYLNMLESGQVHSWSEFWDIYTKEGVKAGGKEAIQLGAAVGLGGYGKNFISKLLLRVAGFEGSGAIIEQELPSKDQLIDSTILFGAFGLAEAGGAKVVNTIKRTNNNAIDIATDYIADKTVVEDLSSKNIDIPRAYKKPETKVVKEDAFKKDIKLDTEAENTILNKIRYAKEEVTAPGKANKLTQGFVDRLHPLYRMVKEVDKTKSRTGKLSVYERFRTLVGMEHRAGHFIEVGTLNKNLVENGKSYKEILKPIGKDKKTYLEFGAYKVAKRIVELQERGIDHGFDIKAAKEVVANKELVKKYEKTSKEFDDYNLRVLTYVKDRGLITQEAFESMVEANKNYVTFSRIKDSAPGEIGYTKNVVNPLKRIKGSKKDIIDPIETAYSNTFHLVKLAERNAALIEFFDFVAKNQKSFPDIQKSARTKQIKIERKELEQILDDTSANFISDKAVENFKVFRKEYLEPTETQVGVIRNGKFETYEVGKELAQALKDFDPKSLGDITKMFKLNAPARWLRAGATASPDFVFPNIFRDTVTAAVFSKYGFVPLWSSLEGAVTLALGKSGLSRNSKEIYNKWLRSGGMQSTLVSIDRNIFDKPAFEILNRGPIRNSLKTPLEYLRLISEFSENMTRISEFKRSYAKSRRNAMTEKEAIERGGFESRDITIDYAKMGLYMKGLNQVAAFYNARVQGYTKIYEAFRDRPGRAMTMITASIILPSIYFWFANKDNEVYQRQPEWVKTNYWVIVKDGVPHRISKPFDLGIVFGTGTEQLLDWLNKEHPDQLNDFLYDFGISTLKSFNPTPTFGVPILESIFDKSFFTGKPLVPDYMDKKLLSKYQYTTYTSEVAKSISRAMNILVGDHTKLDSPIVIDNFIRAWTGSLGRFVVQMTDKGLIEFGIIKDPIKPTDKLTIIPGIRAFNLRDPSGQSEFITDFYKELNKIDKEVNSIIILEKRGEFKEAIELREKINMKNKNVLQLLSIRDALSGINYTIRNIHNTKKYTADEKRELIDIQYLLMIKTAKRGLDYMNLKVDKENER